MEERKHWYNIIENVDYEYSKVVGTVLATESEVDDLKSELDDDYGDVYYTFKRLNMHRSIASLRRSWQREYEERFREIEAKENEQKREPEPIPDGLVRVFVSTACQRVSVDVDPETKISELIENSGLAFNNVSMMTLNGVCLREFDGHYEHTLADFGITAGSTCMLAEVHNSMNV